VYLKTKGEKIQRKKNIQLQQKPNHIILCLKEKGSFQRIQNLAL
jgi:hypothetical protein